MNFLSDVWLDISEKANPWKVCFPFLTAQMKASERCGGSVHGMGVHGRAPQRQAGFCFDTAINNTNRILPSLVHEHGTHYRQNNLNLGTYLAPSSTLHDCWRSNHSFPKVSLDRDWTRTRQKNLFLNEWMPFNSAWIYPNQSVWN